MEIADSVALLAAGLAMGFINNLAGAGGLVGLAGLDLAAGLTGSSLNASLRPAAVGVCLGGVFGFVSKGKSIPSRAWLLGLATVPGAVLGAYLATELPEWVYRTALLVVIVLTLAQQLRAKRHDACGTTTRGLGTGLLMFTLVGLHMGFLQVAVGLVTMLALSRIQSDDLVGINTTKVALLTVAGASSTTYFAATDVVVWPPALWLAGGAALGSFLGSRFTVDRGHAAVRVVVLLVCAFVLLRLGFQWFQE